MIIKKVIKDDYKADSILDLGVDDRCRLAIVLKKKYRLDNGETDFQGKVRESDDILKKFLG